MRFQGARVTGMVLLCASAMTVTHGCRDEPRGSAGASDSMPAIARPALREELLAMAQADREIREGMTIARLQDSTFAERMLESQQRHAARMGEIIDEFGWPGTALVGPDGAESAWLLVQHGGPDLQMRALRLLEQQMDPGVSPQDIALLTDRVSVNRGRPQRYGTQFSLVDGELVLDPLENPDSVDVWRARVGLGPLADYVEQARAVLSAVDE